MSAIGFVGLGKMGGELARRLLTHRELIVYDVSSAAVERLVGVGAVAAAGPGELADRCRTIMVCLPKSEDVERLLFGEASLAGAMRAGDTFVDLTSGDPTISRELYEKLNVKGIAFVDAPVSGGVAGAKAGTIAIIVGAPEELYARIRPVLELISLNVFHAGGPGAGHTTKALNNFLGAGQRLLTYEAVALAAMNGIQPERFIEIINKSSGRTNTSEVTFPRYFFSGNLEMGFSLGLLEKDLSLASKIRPNPFGEWSTISTVLSFFSKAREELGPNADINHSISLFEKAGNVAISRRRAISEEP